MACKGLHCPGCGDGGGGWVALAVVVLVIVAAIARPVAHAASAVGRVVVEALEIAGIVLASAAGLAVAAAAVYGGVRVYRWQAVRRAEREALAARVPAYRVTVVPAAQPVAAPQRAAIEAPSGWHQMMAAAAAVRQQAGREEA